MARTKVNPKDIGDIQIGNVLQPGASGLTSRMGQFIAELPYDIPLSTVAGIKIAKFGTKSAIELCEVKPNLSTFRICYLVF